MCVCVCVCVSVFVVVVVSLTLFLSVFGTNLQSAVIFFNIWFYFYFLELSFITALQFAETSVLHSHSGKMCSVCHHFALSRCNKQTKQKNKEKAMLPFQPITLFVRTKARAADW